MFLQVSVGKPSTQPCFFYSLAVSGVHLALLIYSLAASLPRCKKKAAPSTFGKRLPQPNFDEGVKGVYVKTWYSCTAFLFARVGRGI